MCFTIVDEVGQLTLASRMPGARWVTVELSLGKAKLAAAFASPTAELATSWAKAPLFAGALVTQDGGPYVPAPGGLPIVVRGTVVGAIGASGGTGQQDETVVAGALGAVGLDVSLSA
jgi:uncharacterized protein GlcG (DUF336 family)